MPDTAARAFEHLPAAAAGLGNIFARPKTVAALCVLVLAGLGWSYLALLHAGAEGYLGRVEFLQALCGPLRLPFSMREAALVALMWSAMTLAMMLPSAAPMILTYAEIADTAAGKDERIVSPCVLAAGYTVVWLGFSLVAVLAQLVFTWSALLDSGMRSVNGLFSGAIFIAAGVYQFSALKHACLMRCQQPFPFFFANWATTEVGVFRLGLKQGAYCLGCCWAMMLLMFAVGVMNVIWMTALAVVMTSEKMLAGRRFTHALGTVLIIIGASAVLASLADHWPTRTN